MRRHGVHAAFGDARGHYQIERRLLQLGQHGRQDRFIVLQIGIHHRQVGSAAGQHAFDGGGSQAPPSDPLSTRTRGLACASARAAAAVPSAESSSTKSTS